MDDKNERITGDKMEFVLWFSRKLAALYFEWSKEDLSKKEAFAKCMAIITCIRKKRPYSTCLALDTLINSAENKKQRTRHPWKVLCFLLLELLLLMGTIYKRHLFLSHSIKRHLFDTLSLFIWNILIKIMWQCTTRQYVKIWRGERWSSLVIACSCYMFS